MDVELGHGHAGGVDAVDAPRAADGGRAAGEAAERGEGPGGHLDGDAVAADEGVALGGEEECARAEGEGGEEEGEEARGGPVAGPARQADRLAGLLVRRQGGVAPAVPETRGWGAAVSAGFEPRRGRGGGGVGRKETARRTKAERTPERPSRNPRTRMFARGRTSSSPRARRTAQSDASDELDNFSLVAPRISWVRRRW